MMPSSDTLVHQAAKRRACDECRSRKLACTKEANGCSRCIREKIECHYSEQKQMGRPRKRQRNGEAKGQENDNIQHRIELEQPSFLEESLLLDPYFDITGQHINHEEDHIVAMGGQSKGDELYTAGPDGLIWQFRNEDFNRPIDFGNEDLNSGSEESVLQQPPDESSIVIEHQHIHQPNKVPCGCLAAMYLAMSSLQELPTEINSALATVRNAANTAEMVLRCDQCGIVSVLEPHPPIEVFQNTMMLGTILPTIVNGYRRLLQMVDCETNLAKATGIQKVFNIREYGGLCRIENLCDDMKHLINAPLDPSDWRNAVRGLLRADIYGHESLSQGLRGLIAEMEERQRTRHREVDKLIETGRVVKTIGGVCMGNKDALCLRLLDTAKVAIDALVIA